MLFQRPVDTCPVARSQDIYIPLLFSTTALLFLKAGVHVYNLKIKSTESKKIHRKLSELSLRIEQIERKFMIKKETKTAATQTDDIVPVDDDGDENEDAGDDFTQI